MFGAKRQDVVGKCDFDFFPKEQAEFFTSKDQEVLTNRKVVEIPIEPIQTPMGTRFLHTFKVPSYDSTGEPQFLIGISTDITEEVQMQKQLEFERAKSVHNAKLASLGEMSAGIAHEINNPLAIIDGVARGLKRFKDDPVKFDAKLEVLEKSTGRISRIVNGLKKFARSTDGTERAFAELSRLIEEVLILTENKARRHEVEIQLDLRSSGGILCDTVEIEQVLINLINNGVDAIKSLPDKRWIKIITFDEADQVVVQVIDSGSGISAEVEEKLFQPFFTTKPVGEGTGLGLSITKGILDQHRATITVNRKVPNTCFELRFPHTTQEKMEERSAS